MSNIETRLLNSLKEAQKTFALEALTHPQSKDAFEYGFRSGVIHGYEASVNTLLQLISEDKGGKNDI